ncbi:4'-phosphopantetheinyl transferase superfamily protein [Luteimonas sp. XNQY3]|nr:4'-phosphopantetheinyl transferase superfamily protein [Luteimonas sp. XNQY3]MCD9006286.1 4'-phosphopantetheinyl transferase superfamily protein [Luteimonas sp. XNQY3]
MAMEVQTVFSDGIKRTRLDRVAPAEDASFLRAWRASPWPCVPPMVAIEFDEASFRTESFAAARMSMPDDVVRSVNKRQAEFFHGRLAARAAMRAMGLPAPHEVAMGRSREPVWPEGVVGSISHNARYAVSIAAPRARHSGVGVDVETRIPADALEAVAVAALGPAEMALLAPCTSRRWPSDMLMTAVFSAKESFFKAVYPSVGRFIDFTALRWRGWAGERMDVLGFVIDETLSERWRGGVECTVNVARIDASTVVSSCVW